MHFVQAINSDISVLIVCNKTGGAIKGDIKKNSWLPMCSVSLVLSSSGTQIACLCLRDVKTNTHT